MSEPQRPPHDDPGQPAGPTPEPADPTPEPVAAPHPGYHLPPSTRRAAFGRVVRHRATQLVAVGLLGLVLGGGIVALLDRHRDDHRYGVGADRPGHSRFDERGERGDRGPRGERGERGDRGERVPDRFPGRDSER